jgi:hypothetical protein
MTEYQDSRLGKQSEIMSKTMTLTEYWAQANPQRGRIVVLQEGEFTSHHRIRHPRLTDLDLWEITINHADQREITFIRTALSERLHLSDKDGNPTQPTVFYLPFNLLPRR